MYIGIIWEIVNSIKAYYIVVFLPNTMLPSFYYFLADV
jgi:hypothetical protein